MLKTLLFFSCFVFLKTFAQERAKFTGTWQQVGEPVYRDEYDSVLTFKESQSRLMLTFKDRTVFWVEHHKVTDTYYNQYDFHLKQARREIRFNHGHFVDSINFRGYVGCEDSDTQQLIYHYTFVSDSELVIGEKYRWYDAYYKVEYRLKKTELQTYTPVDEINACFNRQKKEVKARRLVIMKSDSSKIRNLKTGGEFDVQTTRIVPGTTTREEATYRVDAIGKVAGDSLLTVHITKESIRLYNADRFVTENQTYKVPYDYNPVMTTLRINDITSVYYNTRAAEQTSLVSSCVVLLSLASALVVAPLASIQYRKGGFNTPRYFAVACTSLGVMTLCITLSIRFNGNDFHMGKGKKQWQVRGVSMGR